MPKNKIRYVMIDMGHGTMENWERVKVIKSQMFGSLFGETQNENLLVECLNGERLWVAFWKEIDE